MTTEKKITANEWLEQFMQMDRSIRIPPAVPKRRSKQTFKVTRHQSREMKIVSGQTPNMIRAMYVPESDFNRTPVIDPEDHTLTKEVGPHDRYNPDEGYRTGKATESATGAGNKRKYRERRVNGGGTNKETEVSAEAWLKQFKGE
jgi:hypothetical protein